MLAERIQNVKFKKNNMKKNKKSKLQRQCAAKKSQKKSQRDKQSKSLKYVRRQQFLDEKNNAIRKQEKENKKQMEEINKILESRKA